MPKDSPSFGLLDYWWPKSVPLPAIGVIGASTIVAPAAAPDAKQTGINGTVFGSQQSAYGGAIDDSKPSIARPFRFSGPRARVRLINPRSGAAIDCDIVDVAPWKINDPYWQTGTRPLTRTGIDMTGRKTNKAGTDLSIAAANAIQIEGKGLVDWEFIESPCIPSCNPSDDGSIVLRNANVGGQFRNCALRSSRTGPSFFASIACQSSSFHNRPL